jgi:hypothetical protein
MYLQQLVLPFKISILIFEPSAVFEPAARQLVDRVTNHLTWAAFLLRLSQLCTCRHVDKASVIAAVNFAYLEKHEIAKSGD